jgi:hypothetical protein
MGFRHADKPWPPVTRIGSGDDRRQPGAGSLCRSSRRAHRLDQVDIALPSPMRGMGESDLALVADGYQANTLRLNNSITTHCPLNSPCRDSLAPPPPNSGSPRFPISR